MTGRAERQRAITPNEQGETVGILWKAASQSWGPCALGSNEASQAARSA